MKAVAIIPARYDSTRFPGKPLAKLGLKSIIQHVYERAVDCGLFEDVIVGTDDRRISDVVENFGGKVVLTGKDHTSGTDRIAEVCRKSEVCRDADVVVNIQGDEPFISMEPLKKLVAVFKYAQVQVASLMHRISEDIDNSNNVKVVCDNDDFALYFSRLPIPYERDKADKAEYFKHIGVYAFRPEVLFKFVELPAGKLEELEKLEQLRLLENGIRIKMVETEYEGIGIDTIEDLERANRLLQG